MVSLAEFDSAHQSHWDNIKRKIDNITQGHIDQSALVKNKLKEIKDVPVINEHGNISTQA